MAGKKRARKKAGTDGPGRGGRRPGGRRLPPFSFDQEKLPEEIEERAMASGGYPYDKRMKRKRYEEALYLLQIELLKVQRWAQKAGERIAVVFEGRDAAGKGGTIHRFTQHLNPRSVRVVALSKPNEVEQGQWYFQRYVGHLPTRGEIVLFDRSWYNRAGVEPVMGFCKPAQTAQFLEEAPKFEQMLVDDGVRLFKFWLHIGREMQIKRLHARQHDPLKRWKLSPVDYAAIERWDAYTHAFEAMIDATDTERAPWTVVLANDKMRTRLASIRHFLTVMPYEDRDDSAIGEIDHSLVLSGKECLAANVQS